jgi:hypothetical protein
VERPSVVATSQARTGAGLWPGMESSSVVTAHTEEVSDRVWSVYLSVLSRGLIRDQAVRSLDHVWGVRP